MIRKGDTLAIALIMSIMALICLYAIRGAVTPSGTIVETPAADLELLPMPTAEPSAAVRPSPTMTLAVNENSTLFAIIRSQPKNDRPAPTLSPSPSATTTPDKDNYYIPGTPSPSAAPLPDDTPKPKIPPHNTVTKHWPKHHK